MDEDDDITPPRDNRIKLISATSAFPHFNGNKKHKTSEFPCETYFEICQSCLSVVRYAFRDGASFLLQVQLKRSNPGDLQIRIGKVVGSIHV